MTFATKKTNCAARSRLKKKEESNHFPPCPHSGGDRYLFLDGNIFPEKKKHRVPIVIGLKLKSKICQKQQQKIIRYLRSWHALHEIHWDENYRHQTPDFNIYQGYISGMLRNDNGSSFFLGLFWACYLVPSDNTYLHIHHSLVVPVNTCGWG